MRKVLGRISLAVEFEVPEEHGEEETVAFLAGSYSVDKPLRVVECAVSVQPPMMPLGGISAFDPMEFAREILDRLPPKREKWENDEEERG